MRALHVAAVERPEQTSRLRPYQQEAGAKGDGIPRVAKSERPDAKHKHVADDDVEGSPSDVDEPEESPLPGGCANGL